MESAPNGPLVTVVVCVYNAGPYLRASIESVLSQTYKNLEILVIDDGSTDGCIDHAADLLNDQRVRLTRQPNAGKPTALNRALDAARGEFYAVHDADDISYPGRIEHQLCALQADPSLAAAYCGHELILNDKRLAPLARFKGTDECSRTIARFAMPAHDPTGMYRMSAVREMRYEAALPIVEGYDYILRVGEKHPIQVVGRCLYGYRIHGESVTKKNPGRRDLLVIEVLKRACVRRGLDFGEIFPTESKNAQRKWLRNRVADNNLAAHFIESAIEQRRRSDRWGAAKTALSCARLHPLDPHYYKAILYTMLPMAGVNYVRRRGAGSVHGAQ